MRVCILILGFLWSTMCVVGQQNTIKEHVKIDVSERKNLSEVLDAIEKQTNYSFIYDARVIDLSMPVRYNLEGNTVFDLLLSLFKNTDIVYTIINDQIVLNKKETVIQMQENSVQKVVGWIKDKNGEPIVGANILEKGTSNGTITDLNGQFVLKLPRKTILQISYIGYLPQEIHYVGESNLNIKLMENAQQLKEVVVTALGIHRSESSLPYSTQLIVGEELIRAKDQNFINTLMGKTAGLQINHTSSGVGSSSRVIIRGSRSATGNNQPLYVIDGVPMLNSTSEQALTAIGGTANAGNRDGGDGISNLNPDDIEQISILKGASAAALYGVQAANGVIMITTKKGRPGIQRIDFSSTFTIDQPTCLPEFQNSYGWMEGSTNSWGKKGVLPVYDNLSDFYGNGLTFINSLSVSLGSEAIQTYFSYANTTATGIVEHNEMSKHNVNLRETSTLFDGHLKLDANVNLIMQSVNNKPPTGGFYMNPLPGLYTFPRGMDLKLYKDNFEVYNEERNMPVQNWYTGLTDFDQNPYWLINRAQSTDKRSRVIASMKAEVKLTDWLTLQGRGSVDYLNDKFRQKMYASTSQGIAGMNGRYIDYGYQESLIYGDVLAMFAKKWESLSLNAVVGASINDQRITSLRLDSQTASLYYPNVFTIANIKMSSGAYIEEQNESCRQLQSVFATAQLGYRESLYLDMSARNDWASTLAFTKSNGSGFFYPSIGLSWVMGTMVELPEQISFGKLRASWSRVGNDIPKFVSNTSGRILAGGTTQPNIRAPFEDLKPEMSSSVELGTEWKFLDYRLGIDLTFYKTNTRNQLFTLPSPTGAMYKYYFVNAGNIENRGVEATLSGIPVWIDGFKWKTQLNFSTNRNEVKELHDELYSFIYGDEDISSSYSMRLVKGGSFGDIYGKAFARDKFGGIVYGEYGLPDVVGEGNTARVGNCNPDFLLGWSNEFSLGDFSLYILLDGRFGGEVLSQTQAVMDQTGVSYVSGEARKQGYVDLEGHHIYNVESFYELVGGRSGVTEYYMYDATNIRLREVSISYSLPSRLLQKVKCLKAVRCSLVGRNLGFLIRKSPFDPDAVLSTLSANQGLDVFGMPTTRSVGFNIKLSF